MFERIITLFCFIVLLSCQSGQEKAFMNLINTPSAINSMAPNLMHTDGQVYLSWITPYQDSAQALVFSKLENEQWTPPKTIAHGSDWFVNWADFPAMAAFSDGQHLLAHWLQKSAEGTYDYNIMVSISKDQGNSWEAPFILNQDSIPAEHGFVSFVPDENNQVFATWLDGRNTKNEDEDGIRGAMTLRGAFIDINGKVSNNQVLDQRICDCCQTGAAISTEGVFVAYRDRSEKEIRDISFVRQQNGEWTSPQSVYDDNWLIVGCPVNGPAVANYKEHLAVAWFTGNDEGKVQVALSENGGASFQNPIQLNENPPVGRVDAIYDQSGTLWISWVETKGERAYIYLNSINKEGQLGNRRVLIETSSSRKSGFPILTKVHNHQLLIAWTDIDENQHTQVKTALINSASGF